MTLNADELDLLRRIYRDLDPIVPLLPGDARYEPIYETGDREDPEARLRSS